MYITSKLGGKMSYSLQSTLHLVGSDRMLEVMLSLCIVLERCIPLLICETNDTNVRRTLLACQ